MNFDIEDFKYFRNQRNLFENPEYWIKYNPYIKTLKSALETLALEKLKREHFYHSERQTIDRYINKNLNNHSHSI